MASDQVQIRYTSQRGGSISVNIPSDIAKKMELSAGSAVVFLYEAAKKRIVIEKVQSVNSGIGRKIEVSDMGT